MSRSVRTILQVNTRDLRGGAETVAMNLHRAFRRRGLDAFFAVGRRLGDDAGVIELGAAEGRRTTGHARVRLAHIAHGPARLLDDLRGLESFHYPASRSLLELTPATPDIVHAHNLHGGYFDLRELPRLSHAAPLVLTLHDAWLLSGHCSHSFGCERWLTGCGDCPDLTIYPAVRRDRTAFNWRRKQGTYAASRLFVATPCAWLMDRVNRSMLNDAVVDRRVIPNGVDLSVFRAGEAGEARDVLGIPADARVVLFVAAGVRGNPFKDYATLRQAVERLAGATDMRDLIFLALGETAPAERVGSAEIRFIPFEDDAARVALYYRAADVYMHAARAETFPNVVLEALACGTPVVATGVGGIPEQVRGLGGIAGVAAGAAAHTLGAATGVLTAAGDASELAAGALHLLRDHGARRTLGANAARDAQVRFDLIRQVDAYLDWYDCARQQWQNAGTPH